MREHLHEPHHRQPIQPREQIHPLCHHEWTPESDQPNPGQAPTKRRRKSSRVVVSRGLSREE